ncbi:MAG: aminoacyl-tRNA hydrolase [Hyphomicrobiales bacterium]|nr:aminoacyl-tRNA hydrolase [Hyphomicrobiales bacterium]
MIRITDRISIAEEDLHEQFIRASGPGGQNVNKVSTAVELRFDVRNARALTEPVRARLTRLAGSRMTKDGVLVIRADRHRTQDMNRQDARDRLIEMIREAAIPPKPRIKTKPTKASRERRVDAKKRRSRIKDGRRSGGWD